MPHRPRASGAGWCFQSPAGQLGLAFHRIRWLIEGVVITLRMSKARLTT